MSPKEYNRYPLSPPAVQSPPLEFPYKVDDSWVGGKTILITGGASGFGAGFVKRWASKGATIVFGDVNVAKGKKFAETVREETGNKNVHFTKCDVTDWASQVALFKEAVRVSGHGGIDAVVANAGIGDTKLTFEKPTGLDSPNSSPPDLSVLNVNLTGVMYTTHLALFYLSRNPGSQPANPHTDPATTHRDRHLLLMGSMSSYLPLPGQSLYGAAKHAVMGLYRCLRTTTFSHGIRVNIICPYFIDTPLLQANARMVLAGGTMGTIDDVVEAGTRFAADPRIVGRAVSVGPKIRVETDAEGVWTLVEEEGSERGEEKAVWEIYMHDLEDSDVFGRRVVGLLNRTVEIRGWVGWTKDMVGAVSYGFNSLWGKK
ncbi:MAG: hypothetical protein MMC33_006088 [Icmadophila ericetorum]|nr:hypothetical protein [Icmadophila ericetorum]